ncbi:MAG: phosphoribosylamine--glycine ligase [Planctomycetota bacterium]|nr:MAG: phosphoribosylamine--glycine ligase [Planctomycetota bacterium]
MKVLLIGSGGREHVLAWKIKQSPKVDRLFCAPGNAGTAEISENVDLKDTDLTGIVQFAKNEKIDLVVVGPEDPLALGLIDELNTAGIRAFGPDKAAARLEGDKAFAKEMMRHRSVPTADVRIFTKYRDAKAYIASRDVGIVVKAAGLAKGKGAIVCEDPADALIALERIMVKREFGSAGNTVLVEEKLTGPEVSVLALVDENTIYVLENAQDHKPIGEGDTGLNTGGMGAYCPTDLLDDKLLTQIESEILVPIVDALRLEGIKYKGVLYAGLMLTSGGPKVLEFNCRFGDPEAQPILMRLKNDIIDVFDALIDNKLDSITLQWDPRASICVVMASGGYPGSYEKGKTIAGLNQANAMDGVVVFHAGTKHTNGQVITNGGRVLGVTALGETLQDAADLCYQAVDKIKFDGAYYRRDIGAKALKKVASTT